MKLRQLIKNAIAAGACESEINTLRKHKNIKNAIKDENAPYWCYWYVENVIHGKWEEGEPIILTDPQWSYFYALRIIQGRWKMGEPSILTSPYWTYWYTYDIIKERWLEGEPVIFTHPQFKKLYCIEYELDDYK